MNGPRIGVSVNLGNIPKLENGTHTLADGTKLYTKNGDKHRDKGPAEIRPNGYKAYFTQGVLNRNNGPAVVHPDGTQEFWRKGKLIKVVPPDSGNTPKRVIRKRRRKH